MSQYNGPDHIVTVTNCSYREYSADSDSWLDVVDVDHHIEHPAACDALKYGELCALDHFIDAVGYEDAGIPNKPGIYEVAYWGTGPDHNGEYDAGVTVEHRATPNSETEEPDMTQLPRCPDCHVAPGQLHEEGCDVAQCRNTGQQRLSDCGEGPCEGGLGQEVLFTDCRTHWGGERPAAIACRQLGWYARMIPGQLGWHPCGPEEEGAIEDLNRLIIEAAHPAGLVRWDPLSESYVLRPEPIPDPVVPLPAPVS